jgi:hypothetical protein
VTFDKRVEFKKPVEPDISNFMVSPATTVSDDNQPTQNTLPVSAFQNGIHLHPAQNEEVFSRTIEKEENKAAYLHAKESSVKKSKNNSKAGKASTEAKVESTANRQTNEMLSV